MIMMTEGATSPKQIVFQVAEIHKPLLSVARVADMGYECVLKKSGGYLRDEYTNELVPVRRKGSLYIMKAWVKADPFVRPGA